MGCPTVRGDNLRALASGLSYVQADKHVITFLYHLHQCFAHHEIFRAKVGKGGIKMFTIKHWRNIDFSLFYVGKCTISLNRRFGVHDFNSVWQRCRQNSCADTESFVRGGPTLFVFLVDEGKEGFKTTYKRVITDQPAKRHSYGVLLAGRCWPNIEC